MWLSSKGFIIATILGIVASAIICSFAYFALNFYSDPIFIFVIAATILFCTTSISYLSEKIQTYRIIKLLGIGIVLVFIAAFIQGIYFNSVQFSTNNNTDLLTLVFDGIGIGFVGVVFFAYIIFPVMIICVLLIERVSRKKITNQ